MRSAAKMGKKLCKKRNPKDYGFQNLFYRWQFWQSLLAVLSTEIYGQLKLKEAIEMPLKRPANWGLFWERTWLTWQFLFFHSQLRVKNNLFSACTVFFFARNCTQSQSSLEIRVKADLILRDEFWWSSRR